MNFQLVRASDEEIVIWHMDQGHIYVFQIPVHGTALIPGPVHDVPDATQRAETFSSEALDFATEAACSRQLIGTQPKSGVQAMLSCDIGM